MHQLPHGWVRDRFPDIILLSADHHIVCSAYAMTLPAFFDHFNALHDSSKGFEKYLNSEELEAVLRCSGLRRRCEHTIFPHVSSARQSSLYAVTCSRCFKRLYAPLDAPPTTLPIFSDQEAWYLRVRYERDIVRSCN